MRVIHYGLTPALFGVVAILNLACDSSRQPTDPTPGAILVTVSTTGPASELDPDGYTLSIADAPPRGVAVNAFVTIGELPKGTYLLRLDGLAPNCSVAGDNPRSVDVINATSAAPVLVSFFVTCGGGSPWDY